MTELFGKAAEVEVGSRRFPIFGGALGDGFSMAFEVEKGRSGARNTCSLTLFNLNPSDRSEVQTADRQTQVRLRAGYSGLDGTEEPPELFAGTMHHSESRRDGPDIVTTIEARDGGRAVRRARVAQSFAPGVAAETVLRACAQALGVGLGNLNDLAVGAQLEATGSRSFSEGYVLDGWARDELNTLTRSMGLQWSIQSGQLQLRRRGRPLQGTAVLLREGTGLLDAKRAGRANRDAIVVTTMLIPDVWPGRQVRVEYDQIDGSYRVTKARYQGSTDDDTWTIDAECVPLEVRGSEV